VLFVDSAGQVITHASSDAEGRIEAWLLPGQVSFVASAEGYAPEQRSTVVPSHDLSIVLTPASSITGTVYQLGTGQRVAGVVVRATLEELASSERAPSAVSDENGAFTLTALGPGHYRVEASAARRHGQIPGSVQVGIAERVANVNIALEPAARVEGRVVTPDDETPCTHGYVTLGPSPQLAGDQSPLLPLLRMEDSISKGTWYSMAFHSANTTSAFSAPAMFRKRTRRSWWSAMPA
jgi:hypothetical protein